MAAESDDTETVEQTEQRRVEGIEAGMDPDDWCTSCLEFHTGSERITGAALLKEVIRDIKENIAEQKAAADTTEKQREILANHTDKLIRDFERIMVDSPGGLSLANMLIAGLMNKSYDYTELMAGMFDPKVKSVISIHGMKEAMKTLGFPGISLFSADGSDSSGDTGGDPGLTPDGMLLPGERPPVAGRPGPPRETGKAGDSGDSRKRRPTRRG